MRVAADKAQRKSEQRLQKELRQAKEEEKERRCVQYSGVRTVNSVLNN